VCYFSGIEQLFGPVPRPAWHTYCQLKTTYHRGPAAFPPASSLSRRASTSGAVGLVACTIMRTEPEEEEPMEQLINIIWV
jgi:hypothetical protein